MEGVSLFAPSRKRKRPEGSASSASSTVNAERSQSLQQQETIHNDDNSDYATASASAKSFQELGVPAWLVKACASLGIRTPTPVQAATIPAVLGGRDVVAAAQTGSGKTAAFALPILSKLMNDPYGIFALVLTPSRELAIQITEQFSAFGAPAGLRVSCVVGGLDIVKQGAELASQPHVVVATPGRLAHHINLGSSPPDLSRLAVLVLDEADRLLEPSFAPDLDVILKAMTAKQSNVKRQTLLYSATLGKQHDAFMARLGLSAPFRYNGPSNAGGSSSSSIALIKGADGPSSSSSSASAGAVSHPLPLPPSNLKQEYLFLPAAVKMAYLYACLVALMGDDVIVAGEDGGAAKKGGKGKGKKGKKGGGGAVPVRSFAASLVAKPKTAGIVKGSAGKSLSAATAAGDDDDLEGASAAAYRDAVSLVTTGKGASRTAREDNGDDDDDGTGRELGPWGKPARSAIIFVSTVRGCQLVAETLIELGIPCTPLHSALSQHARLGSLAKFKSSLLRILVATDVASRGLDIPSVDLVLNYDCPPLPSDYLHRVGRTARAGRAGRALTFVSQYEVELVHAIESAALGGRQLSALSPGLEEDAVLAKLGRVATAVQLAKSRLAESGFDDKLDLRRDRKKEAAARTAAHAASTSASGK